MRYVIIGCGNVGMELARRWTAAGHEVVGTTTTPDRVPQLKEVCAEAVVLRGSEADKVRPLVAVADGVVIAVSPRRDRLMRRRDRVVELRDTLVGTAHTVVAAHRRVVLLSTTAVYGDAGEDPTGAPVDERTTWTIDLEPAGQAYGTAERTVLELPGGTVLRLPVIYNQQAGMDPRSRLRHAHEWLDGGVPLCADSLAYGVDSRDATAAVEFVMARGLTGVYNVVPDDHVPPTFAEAFGRLATEAGLPMVTFRGEVKLPTRPISSARLRSAGFTFGYGNPHG